ncbi:MAG: hypothetical protein IPI44_14065 [Sulfuritalea sp.]|nr:hypothetical protein [Sulfuritalea sp.]
MSVRPPDKPPLTAVGDAGPLRATWLSWQRVAALACIAAIAAYALLLAWVYWRQERLLFSRNPWRRPTSSACPMCAKFASTWMARRFPRCT